MTVGDRKTALEHAGDGTHGVGRERHEAVADVSRGDDAHLAADDPRRATIVRHRHDGGYLAVEHAQGTDDLRLPSAPTERDVASAREVPGHGYDLTALERSRWEIVT